MFEGRRMGADAPLEMIIYQFRRKEIAPFFFTL